MWNNCCCEKKEECGCGCQPKKEKCCKPVNDCCKQKDCCCEKNDCCEPKMTDCLAKKIECEWRKVYCDAIILPKVGLPSCAKCVMTLMHGPGKCVPKLKINGLKVQSILANNSFYSAEVSCGKWVNLYKAVIPNVPGTNGCKSSGEVYEEALVKLGISIENDNYNWKGSCPATLAISSKAIGMDPSEFTCKQLAALKALRQYLECNKCNSC